ncbi:hypothetical protein O988_07105 [Pseudogymnoascus sp. VKM F-3808]|nr:hypothetical protein O988_07105 [Pseudogymnoascus sp. VKM F-3808]
MYGAGLTYCGVHTTQEPSYGGGKGDGQDAGWSKWFSMEMEHLRTVYHCSSRSVEKDFNWTYDIIVDVLVLATLYSPYPHILPSAAIYRYQPPPNATSPPQADRPRFSLSEKKMIMRHSFFTSTSASSSSA